MADDRILRIGAEFDVSQIVAGTETAANSFSTLIQSTRAAAIEMQNAGLSIDQIRTNLLDAEVAATTVDAALATMTTGTEGVAKSSTTAAEAVDLETEAVTANTEALTANAAASNAAAAGTGKVGASAIEARLATDVLTGNFSRAENALIRFAARGEIIGPILQAAFLPFAAVAFGEILVSLIDKFEKISDSVAGYTKEVQDAEKADIKFSEQALSHALTLEEAHRKLTTVLAEEGAAAESFGDKFFESAERAKQSTNSFIESIPVLGAAVVAYEAIAHAESDAADQATRLVNQQRILITEGIQKQVDVDREAVKLIDAKTAAENAQLSGAGARVASIQNEIAALQNKQKVEEDIAVKEAGLKAIREGGNALEAEKSAKTNVDEEYYYKAIELTGKLATAEQEAAIAAENHAFANADAYTKMQAAKQKNKDDQEKFDTEVSVFHSNIQDKETAKDIKTLSDNYTAHEKYTEDVIKLTEESALRDISLQESQVTSNAKILTEQLTNSRTSELAKIQIIEQVNAQELDSLRKLEDQKLLIEKKALEDRRALLLGGQTELDFQLSHSSGSAVDTEKLDQLTAINGQIEAAQDAHVAKMAELDQKGVENSTKAANDTAKAWDKVFAPIDRAFSTTIAGVLQGTQTISQAFARMGGNIVISVAESLAHALVMHVAHSAAVAAIENTSIARRIAIWITGESAKKAVQTTANATEIVSATATEASKTAAVTTGSAARTAVVTTAEATKHGVEAVAAALSATIAAGVGAAWAFESVLAALPFPINVATAPGVAAAQFAEIEAIGLPKAEKGALVPRDMPIAAHKGEMILPSTISTALQSVIPAMGKFSVVMNEGPRQISFPATQGFSSAMASMSQQISNVSTSSSGGNKAINFGDVNYTQHNHHPVTSTAGPQTVSKIIQKQISKKIGQRL